MTKIISFLIICFTLLLSACGDKNICSVNGCGNPIYQDGLCIDHLKDKAITDSANKVKDAFSESNSKNKICKVDGCNEKVWKDGYCLDHHSEYLDKQLESAKSDLNSQIESAKSGLSKAIFGE